jgi:hypothetical protein
MAMKTIITVMLAMIVLTAGMGLSSSAEANEATDYRKPSLDETGTTGVVLRSASAQHAKSQLLTAASSLGAEREGFSDGLSAADSHLSQLQAF